MGELFYNSNIWLMVICLGLGLFFQRLKSFPANTHLALNNFIIYISLPAIALLHIPEMPFNPQLLFPIATAWIVFIVAVIVFNLLGKPLNLDRKTIGCLILTCGLFNSSFIGFPVVEALFGAEGLQMAIMVDQPGSFIVLSTLGILTAVIYSSGKPSVGFVVIKLVSFPPLLAFTLALILKSVGFQHTTVSHTVLESLASTITPLALVSVGLQLKIDCKAIFWKDLSVGLVYRLVLSPLLLFVLYVLLLNGRGLPVQVSIMEAAMAPMITGAIIASQYGLRPKLANLFIGVGIPLSFLTLAVWYYIVVQFAG